MAEFIERLGVSETLPESSNAGDYYSDLIRGILNVDRISRGHVTCSFTVRPRISNFYNGLHGGVVAAIAEKVAIACVRTIVSEEKPLFLGELSMSYLSAAPINDTEVERSRSKQNVGDFGSGGASIEAARSLDLTELIVEGSVVRSGRNLSVVTVEFKLKGTGKLGYTAQATLFHITASKL